MTSSVACLNAETIAQILDAVRTYDQFNEDIDPAGEHDMGQFTIGGEDYYWKIDYYDRNLERHSPDPADPAVTIRVHASLDGDALSEVTGETTGGYASLNQIKRKSLCRRIYRSRVAV